LFVLDGRRVGAYSDARRTADGVAGSAGSVLSAPVR
jgi:hypothetical protein